MYVDIRTWIFFLTGLPRSNLTAHQPRKNQALLPSLFPYLLAIVRRPLCLPWRHRHPIAHCNCFAVLLPIAPPLPITIAAARHNHAAACLKALLQYSVLWDF